MKKLLFFATAAAVVLSSCSKDVTEVTPSVSKGKVVMTASMDLDAESTRTHLEGKKYHWDAGDMTGVLVNNIEKPVVLTTLEGGQSAEFSDAAGQMSYVGNEDLLFFYPYREGNVWDMAIFDANGVPTSVKMTIPVTQIYRHASFSAMTAPAIAYVEEFEEGDFVEFSPVASYVRVPIRGIGTLERLSMRIMNEVGEYYNLNGTEYVVVADKALKFAQTGLSTTPTPTNYVDIDFGKGAEGLTLYDNQTVEVMFVIPAGLDLVDAKFEFSAKLKGVLDYSTAEFYGPTSSSSPAVKAQYSNFPANTIVPGKEIFVGTDNYYVVEDCLDFITWNYLVKTEGLLKTAYIISDLDFVDFNENIAATEKVLSTTSKEWVALQEYKHNDYAIYTIDGGLTYPYTIVGATKPAEAGAKLGVATIKGLYVYGASIFSGNGVVDNITLENITLDAYESTLGDKVDFVAPSFYWSRPQNTGNDGIVATNVTVKGGVVKGEVFAPEFSITGRLYSTVYNGWETDGSQKSMFTPDVVGYPKFGDKEALYADALEIIDGYNVEISEFIPVKDDIKFGTIFTQATTGVIVSVEEANNATNLLSDIGVLFDKVDNNTDPTKVTSIVWNETSYWTGLNYALNGDNLFTAEELANSVNAGINVELRGLDIDLMGTNTYSNKKYAQNWSKISNVGASQPAYAVDGFYKDKDINGSTIPAADADSRQRVIKNALIKTIHTDVGDVCTITENLYNTYSLFGFQVKLTDVAVDGLNIVVEHNQNDSDIAGLAVQGNAAKNVTVNNLTINSSVDKISCKAIGAVYAVCAVTYNNAKIENVNVTGDIAITKANGKGYAAIKRGIVGKFDLAQSQKVEFTDITYDINCYNIGMIGEVVIKVPATTSTENNPAMLFTNCFHNAKNPLVRTLAWVDATTGDVKENFIYPVKYVVDGIADHIDCGDTTIE